MRAYLRSLDPGLSRPMWILQSGSLANAFGNGVVFPYLLIYLHNVRGIGLGAAGVILAASSVAALVGGPVCGALIDRLGPRPVLAGCTLVSAIGFGGFALVRSPGPALVAAILAGVGNGSFWQSHASMVAALTRHTAYAMQRVLNNLGIGLGGVVGGLIATTRTRRPTCCCS